MQLARLDSGRSAWGLSGDSHPQVTPWEQNQGGKKSHPEARQSQVLLGLRSLPRKWQKDVLILQRLWNNSQVLAQHI